jgi:S1-C subfamily serine protease
MEIKTHKIFKLISRILFVFIFGSIGALWANYYLLPKLSTVPFFARMEILKRFRENVTVVNKTEQITIPEDSAINKIASQSVSSVVDIVSLPVTNSKTSLAVGTEKTGSGAVVTGDGLIVTYRTAILEKNAKYKIITGSGNTLDASLVGVDEFSNLAFLKVEGSNLTSISLANSDDFSAGKKVIALGAGDFQNKYSAGLFSNWNKNFNISGSALSTSEKLEGVFETDFLNQKELVGSPVVDYNGELAGIIGSVKIDNQDKFFVIPSNQVKLSIEKEIQGNLGKTVSLGVYYVSLSKVNALIYNQTRETGALVYSPSGKQGLAVIANSPAEKAGIKIGDIVTMVGDKVVDQNHPLSNLVNEHKAGDEFEITVLRVGNELKLKIKL